MTSPAPKNDNTTDLSSSGGLPDRTSAEIFERHVGSTFRLIAGPGETPQVVLLTKVTRSQTITQPGRGAPELTPAFSLIFRGPTGPVLPQDTYRVEHPHLGAFPLFLVPIGPNQANACYQAVFA